MRKFEIIKNEKQMYSMGAVIGRDAVHFSVAAEGKECFLILYYKGKETARLPFPQEEKMGDVFNITVQGDFSGIEYLYEIDGKFMEDPYGKAFTGHEVWGDMARAKAVMKTPVLTDAFEWEGDQPLHIPYEDSVIYRIHTRGLTKHTTSKVKDKGTFRAIIEKIPYIKELGVTTVELMPPSEFKEVVFPETIDKNPYGDALEPTGKLNYWGYTKGCMFAPKASYCPGHDKHPVYEFKHLVKEMHKAGLELVIELFFTGKEKASFVLDVVRFWVHEYHVDGVHLVGYAPVPLLAGDPYLSHTKLWATTVDGCDRGKEKHLAEYNDGFLVDMRRILKGDEDQVNNLIFRTKRNPKDYGVINYIANTNGFTLMDMVSYDMKHNEANGENNQDGNAYNYSWNCGLEGPTRKRKIVSVRKKQIRNALLLLFLSQGVPLLMAGDEFGNSKSGNNNSYCQDNEISWLNWNQQKTNSDIYEFTKNIIAFRKKHPVFHKEVEPKNMDYLACGHPDVSYHGVKAWCPEFENFRRQLGIMYCGLYGKKADGTDDDYFFVAYNMHWEAHEFALPNLPKKMQWHLAINTDDEKINGIYEQGQEPVLENTKLFEVPPRTIVVFIGK